jgi:isopentenyldiphosphate isomerase
MLKYIGKVNELEYRDLYDENKNLTGEKIQKGDHVPKGKYYLTVVVWIQNSKNEFLLQINKKYNMWTTTGGHPKTGETSLDGIVTEIKEELGIDIEKYNLTLFKTIKTEDDFVDLYYIKQDINLNSIVMQIEEVDSVRWFSMSEITELINNNKFLPPHIEFYYDCLQYLNE